MRRLLLALVLAGVAAPEEETAPAPTAPAAAEIARALENGALWLRSQQAGDGSWGALPRAGKEKTYAYPAGLTALSLLALVEAGADPEDERIARGYRYLESYYRVPDSTYETAFLLLAVAARADARGRETGKPRFARGEKTWLKDLQAALAASCTGGGWRYGKAVSNPHGIDRDLCHTQFAMAALHEAHRLGVRAPRAVVGEAVAWTLSQQDPDGLARGWSYARKSPLDYEARTTGSMTAGAVHVLLVGGELLEDVDSRALRRHRKAIGVAVHDGLAWLDLNWSVERNPPADRATGYHCLYLYALERVGSFRRAERLGTHDWYAEGARWLVDNQKKEGLWDPGDTHPPGDVISTAFALLFLARASTPGRS